MRTPRRRATHFERWNVLLLGGFAISSIPSSVLGGGLTNKPARLGVAHVTTTFPIDLALATS